MIVLDLDGTLLNSNKKVSDESKTYLKKLKEQGIIIVVATGRIYASALNATDGAEFVNYVISDTGSCAYNVDNNETVFKNTINKKTTLKILNYFNDNYRYIDVCDKDTIYKYSNETEIHHNIITTMDLNLILKNCKEISHISISLKTNDMVFELYNKLIKEFVKLNIIMMQDSFSDRKWIEIMPKGCSKYNGIKKLAKYLKVKNNDIICFGDGLNDIEMLEKSNYGVALKNALPEVKKVAKDITKYDNDHNGVINYLKEKVYVD